MQTPLRATHSKKQDCTALHLAGTAPSDVFTCLLGTHVNTAFHWIARDGSSWNPYVPARADRQGPGCEQGELSDAVR